MKKIFAILITCALLMSMVACGSTPTASPEPSTEPTVSTQPTLAPTPEPTPEPTPSPSVNTYSVTISDERYDGTVDRWQIDGVFAESVFFEYDVFPTRVFYVTKDHLLTTLEDFYPGDYPYCGAITGVENQAFCYDYNKLKPFGKLSHATDSDGESYIVSGSIYENLPKGSWYFGDAQISQSFIIVVDDYESAENGTVPFN